VDTACTRDMCDIFTPRWPTGVAETGAGQGNFAPHAYELLLTEARTNIYYAMLASSCLPISVRRPFVVPPVIVSRTLSKIVNAAPPIFLML